MSEAVEMKFKAVSKNGTKVHDSVLKGRKERYIVYGIRTRISSQLIFQVFKINLQKGDCRANWEVKVSEKGEFSIACFGSNKTVPVSVHKLVTEQLSTWIEKMPATA